MTLSFISLRNKQVGYVSTNMIFITGGIASEDLLQPILNVIVNISFKPFQQSHT